MVKYLSETFGALADPTRREMLERLSNGPLSVSDLAAPFGLSLPGALKHVRVLEDAKLVRTSKTGRTRWCEFTGERMGQATAWIERFSAWERRLDRFEGFAKKKGER